MKRNSKQICASVAVVFFLLLFLPRQEAFSTGTGEGEITEREYHYVKEGKPDPFKPFIEIRSEKEKKEEAEKAAEEVKVRPPLERFGVEEFKLVGIIWSEATKIAVVEDSTGKHHSLSEGSRIGVNEGMVEKILPDQVVVVEMIKDAFENVRPERSIIKLMGEED